MKKCDRCGQEDKPPNQPVRAYLLDLMPQYRPEDRGQSMSGWRCSLDLCNPCAGIVVSKMNDGLRSCRIDRELVEQRGRQE